LCIFENTLNGPKNKLTTTKIAIFVYKFGNVTIRNKREKFKQPNECLVDQNATKI